MSDPMLEFFASLRDLKEKQERDQVRYESAIAASREAYGVLQNAKRLAGRQSEGTP